MFRPSTSTMWSRVARGLATVLAPALLGLPAFGACSSSSPTPRTCWNEGATAEDGCYCDDALTREQAPHPAIDQCTPASVGGGAICCTKGMSCVCGRVGCLVTPGIACGCGYRLGESSTICDGSSYKRCCKGGDGCGCDNLATDCGTDQKVAQCAPSDIHPSCDSGDRQVDSCTM
jgi:hypothetical protein